MFDKPMPIIDAHFYLFEEILSIWFVLLKLLDLFHEWFFMNLIIFWQDCVNHVDIGVVEETVEMHRMDPQNAKKDNALTPTMHRLIKPQNTKENWSPTIYRPDSQNTNENRSPFMQRLSPQNPRHSKLLVGGQETHHEEDLTMAKICSEINDTERKLSFLTKAKNYLETHGNGRVPGEISDAKLDCPETQHLVKNFPETQHLVENFPETQHSVENFPAGRVEVPRREDFWKNRRKSVAEKDSPEVEIISLPITMNKSRHIQEESHNPQSSTYNPQSSTYNHQSHGDKLNVASDCNVQKCEGKMEGSQGSLHPLYVQVNASGKISTDISNPDSHNSSNL